MSVPKILIIDDDAAVSTVIKFTLQDNYDVATTTSALSALKYLSECRVDLILLDIRMPEIDGIEALKEIKKRYPEIEVVMLTAFASDENIRQARELGAYGFINKPFDIDALRDYVDRVLAVKCSPEFKGSS